MRQTFEGMKKIIEIRPCLIIYTMKWRKRRRRRRGRGRINLNRFYIAWLMITQILGKMKLYQHILTHIFKCFYVSHLGGHRCHPVSRGLKFTLKLSVCAICDV
jgi:hypothetical protein